MVRWTAGGSIQILMLMNTGEALGLLDKYEGLKRGVLERFASNLVVKDVIEDSESVKEEKEDQMKRSKRTDSNIHSWSCLIIFAQNRQS